MKAINIISSVLTMAMLFGCATPQTGNSPSGSSGPKVVVSGTATESGQQAEVGVQFSSMGDFTALFIPKRWKSPLAAGGSLSWVNPKAWSEDAGRTGRILIGEAVVVGGVAIAASGGGGGGSGGDGDDGSSPSGPGGTGGGTPPIPPPPPSP